MEKVKLTLSIPKSSVRELRLMAKRNKTSISDIVVQMQQSMTASEKGGRLHPMLKKFKDGLFDSGSPNVLNERA